MKQIILIIILIIFSLNTKVQADNIKIIDGDTIIINEEKIRFSGIDTPELKQTCQKNNKILSPYRN